MSVTMLLAALGAQPQVTPPSGPQIEVAQANWAQFQPIRSRLSVPTGRMVDAVGTILRNRACNLPGQRPREFNITVNYAMRLDASNRPERIVVQDIGCREIETLVGGIVSDMLRYQFFNLPTPAAARWYTNSINFNLAS